MNCNVEAFEWIIDLVKVKTNFRSGEEENLSPCQNQAEMDGKIKGKLYEINTENCLNKLVTSHFLQIWWIYEAVWEHYFQDNFADIVNGCKISLTNLNSTILKNVAQRVSDAQLDAVKERKDKFLSNVYKQRIEEKLMSTPITGLNSSKIGKDTRKTLNEQSLFYCMDCNKCMTLT